MNNNVDKIYEAIVERDRKDAEIDNQNRKNLLKVGFNLHKPKKILRINTGKTIGIQNVVNYIELQLHGSEKIISIEGVSGCGKSSTAEMLAKKIGANQISIGEIFRYLTYQMEKNSTVKLDDIILNLSLEASKDKIYLHRTGENVSIKLNKDLHTHNIDTKVADVARICQAEVIKFLFKEIKRLVESSQSKLIIDGRAHSLDFLPSDIRIVLFADGYVRAERRLKQNGG